MPIDSIYDFTDKALVELKSWLEPWFLTRDVDAAGGAGIQFTNTTAATYGAANSGQALEVATTGPPSGSSGYGINIVESSGDLSHNGGINIEVDGNPGNGLNIQEFTGAGMNLETAAGGTLALVANGGSGSMSLVANGTGGIVVQTSAGGGVLQLNPQKDKLLISLPVSGAVLQITHLPTSSAGLPSGALWNNSGVVNIV